MSYYVSNILNAPKKRQKQDNSKAFLAKKISTCILLVLNSWTRFFLCFNTGKWDCRELSIALDIIYILSN